MTKPKTESCTSVWNSITDTPKEAANLRLRSELMEEITALIQKNGWTQLEAAKRCSVTQPCIDELLRATFRTFCSMRWSTSPRTLASGCM